MLNQPIVLGVEDGMHGREADILVGAAIAGDVVRVEQLIVIGEVISEPVCRLCVAGNVVGVRSERSIRTEDRDRIVSDVDQELMACAHGIGQVDRRRQIPFHEEGATSDAVVHHQPAAGRVHRG